MMFVWACVGLVLTVGSANTASAQTQVQDPLECSAEEYLEAQRAIPRSLSVFYKPLLVEDFSEMRSTLSNENSVRWHVNCILYDKACTRLGKAMQYFVTNQGGARICKSCQTACVQRRIRTVLQEIHCQYPQISQEIREFFMRKDGVDILTFFLGNNPAC
ncbi:hypothetical protein O3P69_003540 [Scylla paramamosain]|uniref:Uncharacterized protein n=1 Tax=Scylla paramamosain TaxID=85552 RepID=A0AAW0UJ67_SCYPA